MIKAAGIVENGVDVDRCLQIGLHVALNMHVGWIMKFIIDDGVHVDNGLLRLTLLALLIFVVKAGIVGKY